MLLATLLWTSLLSGLSGLCRAAPPTWSMDDGQVLVTDVPAGAVRPPLDALLQDMDGDGDLDLLVNRHLVGLLLYERRDGAYLLLNGVEQDQAGLDVPPGVRTVFATAGDADLVQAAGLVVWQPRTADGRLQVRLQRQHQPGPRWLRVAAHSPLEVVEASTRVVVESDETVRVRVSRKEVVEVLLRAESRTPWFQLTQLDSARAVAERPLPFFVGGDMDRFEQPELEFWATDPHGVAWGQIGGGPEPELVVVRGGNIGRLQHEGLMKDHLFYEWTGQPDAHYGLVAAALPADSTRGRAVEWLDLDADGLPELSLTNRDGPNSLMVWRPAETGQLVRGAFEDRGDVSGLAAACSEVVAFLDFDEDGWDDQVALCESGFEVRQNVGVGAMVSLPAGDIGLPATGLPAASQEWLRQDHLVVADIDGDGHLDLLAVALGPAGQVRAWCGDPSEGFSECGAALGLGRLLGVRQLRVADVDQDGWSDLIVSGNQPWLMLGGPDGFVAHGLPGLVAGVSDLERALVLPVARADGGPPDLLLLGRWKWQLARSAQPVGALVRTVGFGGAGTAWPPGVVFRATWLDGHAEAVRVGSHGRSMLSQAMVPISFASPAGQEPPRLEVRWPGRSTWESVNWTDQIPFFDMSTRGAGLPEVY